jgi:hypothetical protein
MCAMWDARNGLGELFINQAASFSPSTKNSCWSETTAPPLPEGERKPGYSATHYNDEKTGGKSHAILLRQILEALSAPCPKVR